MLDEVRLEVEDADRIRIAIALCALKFKPVDRSFTSYVLDLCGRFPLPTQSEPSWRVHALALERKYTDLQSKYEADQIKILSLSATATASVHATPTENSTLKKRQKKKVSDKRSEARASLEAVLDGLDDRAEILAITGPRSVVASFETFQRLIEVMDEDIPTQPALLVSVTCRALEALGGALQNILPPYVPTRGSSRLVQTLSSLLSNLLVIALPLLHKSKKKKKALDTEGLDTVLGVLATSIFVPIIRSFTSLSQSYIASLLSPSDDKNRSRNEKQKPDHDIRTDLLSLFQNAFSVFAELAFQSRPSLYGFRDILALDAVHELEKLYPSPNGHTTVTNADGTMDNPVKPVSLIHRRVLVLANKDALWYLCNILHVVFTSILPGVSLPPRFVSQEGNSGDDGLLKERLLACLSGLIRRNETRTPKHAHGQQDSTASELSSRSDGKDGLTSQGNGDKGSTSATDISKSHEGGSMDVNVGVNKVTGDKKGAKEDEVLIDEVGQGMIMAVLERYWMLMSM